VLNDVNVRTNGIPQRALRWYLTGGTEQRRFLDAFASGINLYGASHSDTTASQFLRVLPVTPADILANYQHLVHYGFMTAESNVSGLVGAWLQGSAILGAQNTVGILGKAGNGSNGWALAPGRTKSGNAILMGNPHLPWGINQPLPGAGAEQWFEAHLITDTLNAHGATFVGIPFISIGFSDDLGWTHTTNPLKNADLYELTLVNGGYLWEGHVLPLLHRQEQIRIRQPDGTLATQNLDVFSSIQGPIVAQQGNKALALRVAGLDAPAVVSEYWDMIRAHNLQEFTEANSRLQMPYFNLVYADRHGDIMYLFGGRQPVRSGGTYADWLGILPGDRASAFWTRTLPWSELPKTINPAGGFVQNGNDAPWTSTFPQAIFFEHFPAYIAPQGPMAMRPQHSARFLLSMPRFSLDDVLEGKMSTRMELASRLLPDLIAAAQASGNPTAIAAANVLEAWDGTSDAASRGAALFELWVRVYISDPNTPKSQTYNAENGIYPAFKTDWSTLAPLTTPRGLADPASAVPALVTAANLLQQQFGGLDVPWGDVHRTVLVTWDADLTTPKLLSNDPVSGSESILGGIRVVEFAQSPQGLQLFGTSGDGYVQLVEFTNDGPRAQTLLGYGNASRPGSAHIVDQLPFFDAKRLRSTPITRAEVEAQTVRREMF
jgi:acyl-homoserine-lactone acylase